MEWLRTIAKQILKEDLNEKDKSIEEQKKVIDNFGKINLELEDKIFKLENKNPKEEYYNNKYPKTEKTYYKQLLGKSQTFDIRCFVGNFYNIKLPKFTGVDDEIAITALSWIVGNKNYKSDSSTSGLVEYWNMSYESLLTNQLDCEDGAILLYDILRAHNIPAWRLRVVCGWAVNPFNGKTDGHAYTAYYSEKYNKWVALDWCYLPNVETMDKQPEYKDVSFYGDVWFSFNEEYSWSKAK